MHQYLLGHGYWSYVEGANVAAPDSAHKDFPVWEQATSKVLYCLASCVHDHMLDYIRDAKTPKEAWENLKKIVTASTTAQKLLLQQEMSSIRQKDLSVTDYTTKIKEICDALGSINVTLDKDELVQTCLGGLAQRYGPISDSDLHPEEAIVFLRVAIDAGGPRKPREWVEDHSIKQPDVVHGGGTTCARREQGGSASNSGSRQEQERRHEHSANNSSRPSTSSGNQGGAGNRQAKPDTECWVKACEWKHYYS